MELRQAFSNGLIDLAKGHEQVMLVESDIECSARKWFKQNASKQFVNTGVAEQNAVGVCGGLSSQGFVPYWYTYGFLIGRAYDQILQSVAVDKRNVKIFGYNCCVSGLGGRSHNCVNDIALMRLIPDMAVVAPADEFELYKAVMTAYTRKGSVYVRFGRGSVPTVTKPDDEFRIGKARIMRSGDSKLILVACGSMVDIAMQVAKEFNATVVNMSTIKPLDVKTLSGVIGYQSSIVTLEEGYVNGGLGDAVSQEFSIDLRIGVEDVFMQSGKGDLRSKYRLDVESVRRRLRKNGV
jgi:transketolase